MDWDRDANDRYGISRVKFLTRPQPIARSMLRNNVGTLPSALSPKSKKRKKNDRVRFNLIQGKGITAPHFKHGLLMFYLCF